jgi:hypothetical protein
VPTPPTRVASYITDSTAPTNTKPKTISGIPMQNGDLLVVDAVTYDNAGTNVFTTAPTGGSGLTWTSSGVVAVSGLESRAAWSAPVGSDQTASITLTHTATHPWLFTLTVWRAHGGIGAWAAAHNGVTGGTPSVTLNGVQENSAIHYSNGDWNVTAGARTYLSSGVGTATELYYILDGTIQIQYNLAVYPDVGAAGNKTVGQSAPTGQRWAAIGIEIIGSSTPSGPVEGPHHSNAMARMRIF